MIVPVVLVRSWNDMSGKAKENSLKLFCLDSREFWPGLDRRDITSNHDPKDLCLSWPLDSGQVTRTG